MLFLFFTQQPSIATADGVATATATGVALHLADGVSAGVATATSAGASSVASAGAAAGAATPTAAGASAVAAVGASTGLSAVTGLLPSVTTDQLSYADGEDILVTWTGLTQPTDRIVIVPDGAAYGAIGDWVYSDGTQTIPGAVTGAGSHTFTAGSTGDYRARLLRQVN